MDKNIK